MPAAGGVHVRGESREGLRGRIVKLGGIEVATRGVAAAFDQHIAVKSVEQRCGREGARSVKASHLADGVGDGIVKLGTGERPRRIRASGNQDSAVIQQRCGVIHARVLERRHRGEGSLGRIENLLVGDRRGGVEPACDQHAAVGEQRRRMMAPPYFHHRQLDESADRWIEEFRRVNRFASAVESARKQDSVVVEDGCSQTGNANREAGRHSGNRVGCEVENFGARQRCAGTASTTDDQCLSVGQHRGGMIGARGMETRGSRPRAGSTGRQRQRHRDHDEHGLQGNRSDTPRRFAGTLMVRIHISPSRFCSVPERRERNKGPKRPCDVVKKGSLRKTRSCPRVREEVTTKCML